jgi:hypothetical protein
MEVRIMLSYALLSIFLEFIYNSLLSYKLASYSGNGLATRFES